MLGPLTRMIAMTKSHINQEEVKSRSTHIPKEIHFIWLGGPIPENYLRSILDLSIAAKRSGFVVNLWVDDSQNYQKTANKIENKVQADFPKNINIKIRNIYEIQALMADDSFFQKDKKNKQYWTYLDLERIGFKNLGAASDFLRYAILYFMGGYYFDTDTEFDLCTLSAVTFTADEPAYGFMVNGALKYRIYRGRSVPEVDIEIGCISNDMIAALPKHPIFEYTILEVLSKYSDLIKNKKNRLSDKRSPFDMSLFSSKCQTTINCSGPNAFADGIEKHIKKLLSDSNHPDLIVQDFNSKTFQRIHPKFAGLSVTTHSHQTWLKNEFDVSLMSENNFAEEKFLDNQPILVKYNDGRFKLRGRKNDKWQLTEIKDINIPKEWDFSGKIKVTIRPSDNDIYKAFVKLHTPDFPKKDIPSFDDNLLPKFTIGGGK